MNSRYLRLDDEDVRRLLAPVMDNPEKILAYASAAPAPGTLPVDEVLLTETDDGEHVVWVRHPESYTHATGHLLDNTDDGQISLLRCWQHWIFELADLVEADGDRRHPTERPAQYAYLQVHQLRWTASYALTYIFSGIAHDEIRDAVLNHPDGGLSGDLGDLPAEGAAQIAAGGNQGAATLIPPGWGLRGWDPDRPPHPPHPVRPATRPAQLAPGTVG